MKIAIAVIVVAALGGGTWYAWPSAKPANGAKTESKRVKVERGDVTLSVTATGEIKPIREVELKSKASGQVVRFKKEPGDAVEEGELIAELDKKTEQRNLSREESNLATAEARLELTRLEYQRSLKQGESETAAAREDEKVRKEELLRLERLTGDLVTQTELANARLAARLTEEKTKQADASLALVRGRKNADEKLVAAEVQRGRVAVEDAQERLRDTEVRAPMKGILLKKLVEEGQIVASGISASTGGTAISVVADVSSLRVEANVDETDIARVKKDQTAEISLLSGTADRFKGRVELILPKGEIDSNVIVFKVRVTMEGDIFRRAYPGMTASVTILVDKRKDVLTLPSEAIKIADGKSTVQIPDGAGSKAVPIRTGIDNGIRAEILEGLAEGAEVLVTKALSPDGRGGRARLRF